MFFNFNMHENCKKREGKKSGKWPHHRKRARGRLVRVRDSLLILQLQRFEFWEIHCRPKRVEMLIVDELRFKCSGEGKCVRVWVVSVMMFVTDSICGMRHLVRQLCMLAKNSMDKWGEHSINCVS
mmetsp:Transcript_6622/g.16147  ORF Transcript_6622/g.16147 Transcript_6622/m.16147 type:complete len:125 (+) Transcript_6622:110-484(+)